jgi:hypothetical protein
MNKNFAEIRKAIAPAGLALLMATALAACTASYSGETPVRVSVPSARIDVGSGPGVGPANAADLHIPPGHRPPPGACRVWYPGRPPGQQPPPTSCGVAMPAGAVPAGAVLIRG